MCCWLMSLNSLFSLKVASEGPGGIDDWVSHQILFLMLTGESKHVGQQEKVEIITACGNVN